MKRLNSYNDDNVPIYIFLLLVAILILSLAGTSWSSSSSGKREVCELFLIKMANALSTICLIFLTLLGEPIHLLPL